MGEKNEGLKRRSGVQTIVGRGRKAKKGENREERVARKSRRGEE